MKNTNTLALLIGIFECRKKFLFDWHFFKLFWRLIEQDLLIEVVGNYAFGLMPVIALGHGQEHFTGIIGLKVIDEFDEFILKCLKIKLANLFVIHQSPVIAIIVPRLAVCLRS